MKISGFNLKRYEPTSLVKPWLSATTKAKVPPNAQATRLTACGNARVGSCNIPMLGSQTNFDKGAF
jgi:hypothetical protein